MFPNGFNWETATSNHCKNIINHQSQMRSWRVFVRLGVRTQQVQLLTQLQRNPKEGAQLGEQPREEQGICLQADSVSFRPSRLKLCPGDVQRSWLNISLA